MHKSTLTVPVRPAVPAGSDFAALRRQCGYSQTQAAVIAGVDKSSIQRYESGVMPRHSHMVTGIARAYRRLVKEAKQISA